MTVPPPDFAERKQYQERPVDKPIMFQSWQKLLFLHWRFEPDLIQQQLPTGLHVDTFNGAAWVGIVPFYMRKIRPTWSPVIPHISNFLELNVRTYVFDDNGTPGVWFFSLDANRWIAVQFGKSLFRLAYEWAKMTATEYPEGWIDYHCRRFNDPDHQNFQYSYKGTGQAAEALDESLEFFLVERYILFSQLQSGGLATGRVHHTPYQIQSVELTQFSEGPLALNQLPLPNRKPDHAAYVEGVDVEIFKLQK